MVNRVTICAADVVAPVLAATIVVVLFLACMASETAFRDLFARLVLERDNLGDVATTFDVFAARAVTLFAARDLPFPTGRSHQLGVRRVCKGIELIFVTSLTSLCADIVGGLIRGRWWRGIRFL